MADNLPPSSADVMESGSLNLPDPSGPHRPVVGLLCLSVFPYVIQRVENRGILGYKDCSLSGDAQVSSTAGDRLKATSCIFSVAQLPNAGHILLILDVSRSHTTTHHSR
jgi:hypothetical protein